MWVDNFHGQRPAGSVIANPTIARQEVRGLAERRLDVTPSRCQKQETRGTIHLLRTHELAREAPIPAGHSDSLTQVNFGWEICSTGGKPMDFTVTHYGLTTKR